MSMGVAAAVYIIGLLYTLPIKRIIYTHLPPEAHKYRIPSPNRLFFL